MNARGRILFALIGLFLLAMPGAGRAASDPKAVALAESTMVHMGGKGAWSNTHYLQWMFFGKRKHTWDMFKGVDRIESGDKVFIVDVHSKDGHAFDKGVEITDPAEKKKALETAYEIWVNDSYWLIMPYKLLDPGTHLTYLGESKLEDGRPADKLGLTFDDGVGVTPKNRYDIWIARDTGLVEQWSYYEVSTNPKPDFTMKWGAWKKFGKIMLATDHGQGPPWDTAAPDSVPAAMFQKP